MILSEKHLTRSVRELKKLQSAMDQVEFRTPAEARAKAAEVISLRSRIIRLKREIQSYRNLRRGKVRVVTCDALKDLAGLLIKARIISRTTQSELARAIGAAPQQIQRYEASEYAGAGLEKVIEISQVLGVKVSAVFDAEEARQREQAK